MNIREATSDDFDRIWPISHEITAAGETYGYPRDTTREEAILLWMEIPKKTYVLEGNGEIFGTYYIKTNQAGPGDHVCNCGYMVSSTAGGVAWPRRCANTPRKQRESSGTRRCSSILWRPAMRARYDSGTGWASLPWAGYPGHLIIRPKAISMRWLCTSGWDNDVRDKPSDIRSLG